MLPIFSICFEILGTTSNSSGLVDDGNGKQEDDQGEIAEKRNQEDSQGKIAGKGRQEEDQAWRLVRLGISSRSRARDHPQALSVTRTLHSRRCLQVMEEGSRACPMSSGRYDYPLDRGGDAREPDLIGVHSYLTPLLLVSAQGVLIPITPRGGEGHHMRHLPRLAPHLPQRPPQKDLPL